MTLADVKPHGQESTGPRARYLPVIVNGTAGAGHDDEQCERLREILGKAGLDARIMPARSGEELTEIARRVVRERPAAVVAGGGDGTVNAVGSVLAGTDIALGVLPLGTLNHFARDVGVPLDLEEAARTLAAGHVAAVDVGEVNGRLFLNNSSLGLYPRIVRGRDQQRRRLGRGKWMALLWATWTTLRRSPFLRLTLCLDGREAQCSSSFVFIGNNEYLMEGFNIGVREHLDRGQLSVYLSRRRGRLGLLALGLRALFGRLRQAHDFHAMSAHTLVIETRHRHLHVATDGEVEMMETPLEYRIRPRALRVLVPPPEREE